MLVEWLKHTLIRCPPALKEAGVLYDLIALESRARRLRRAWQPHHETCRRLIAGWAEQTPQGGCVVVLGSGLLLEIPLDVLTRRFRRVVLVDLFHMPSVRRRARALPGVELYETDLTGCFDRIATAAAAGILPEPQAVFPQAEGADLVISANCLSQLSLRPAVVAWHGGALVPDRIRQWEAQVVAAHLAALQELPCRVGLICDTARIGTQIRSGIVQERYDLVHGVPLPPFAEGPVQWDWQVAPAPEDHRQISYHHTMTGGLLRTGREPGRVSPMGPCAAASGADPTGCGAGQNRH